MNENNNKMRGFVKPFQSKGGGSWNLNLETLKVSNDYINAEFLKGVSIWSDFGYYDGQSVERTCSINISDNPKYAEIVKAIIDKFEGADTFYKYMTTSNNSVEVEFELIGFSDKYNKEKKETYLNAHVKNIALV